MADIDPRITSFLAESEKVMAASQRAGRVVARTEKKAMEADQAVGRLRASAQSRGAGNLTTEAEASGQVEAASKRRTVSYEQENAALKNLTKTRGSVQAQMEAEARIRQQSLRNLNRYGPYAGGRRNYEAFGEAGIGAVPPGGKTPIPGAGYGPPPGIRALLGPGPKTITDSDPFIAREAQYITEQRAAVQGLTTSMSKLAVEENLAGQEMRKNGALTTEYIAAVKRGETTIAEFGYQTSATIGKFGGWLAAGSAVYGVFSAVQKLGAGAVDAYSGVNELQRVINDVNPTTAKAAFSGLAGEFNLPIKDVSDAVYQMGKVFHTQNGALAAAKSVLYSVKVGELDTADATRYLIAIVNGFHLPASRMAEVFDQINQAQNEFGITIGDVEAGLAKASGTFHAAGGSYSNLLALITTAQKATGNTGQVIGTAIARAPNFLRKPQNEAVLKEFGIKPGQAIDKTIEQAFNVSQKLSGKRLQLLAAAIFGPQYGARIGTPLLQQKDLYDEVKRKTSPGFSKGSAERELRTQLGSVREEASKLGVTFERLGAQLADSHALDVLGAFLKLLNLTLEETVHLAEAFNQLPEGMKQSLSYAVELALVLRGMRRFNVGESIAASGSGGVVSRTGAALFGGGTIGEARRYRQGLIIGKEDLETRLASATTRNADANALALKARQLQERELNEVSRLSGQAANDPVAKAALDEAKKNSEGYAATVAAQGQVMRDTNLEAKVLKDRLDGVTEGLKQTNSGFLGTLNAQKAIEHRETHAGETFYAPTTERPAYQEALTGKGVSEAEAAKLSGTVSSQVAGMAAASTALKAEQVEGEMQSVEASVSRNAALAGRLRGTATAIGGALDGLLNRIGSIFFAGAIAALVYSFLDGLEQEIEDERGRIEEVKIKSSRELSDVANRKPQSHSSIATTVSDFFTESGTFSFINDAYNAIGKSGIPGASLVPKLNSLIHPNAGGPGAGQELTEAEERVTKEVESLQRTREFAERHNEPVPYNTVEQLRHRLKRIEAGPGTNKQKLRELEKLEAENQSSIETTSFGAGTLKERRGRVKGLQQAIELAEAFAGTTKDFASALRKMDAKTLEATAGDYNSLIQTPSGRFDPQAAERARLAYEERARQLSQTSGPEAAKKLGEAQSDYYEAITGAIEDELKLNLERAQSPQARQAAYTKAIQTARQSLGGFKAKERAAREDARRQAEQVAALERQVEESASGLNAPTVAEKRRHELPGNGTTEAAVRRAKAELAERRTKLRHVKKISDEEQEVLALLEENAAKAAYEFDSALRDARFGYRASRTQDPMKQAQLTIDRVGEELPRAVRVFGRESQQVYSLLETKAQAINDEVQQELALIGARDEYVAAGVDPNDQVATARAALRKLEDELAFEKAHPNNFDPAQVIQIEAQIRASKVALAQSIEQEAKELRDAAFGKRIARYEANGQRLRAINAQIAQTRYDIAHAKTPVEKAQLESQLPKLRATKQEERAKIQLENIEFDANIDKITTTQEIVALERLLHDYKLSKDMRRSIREQIHSLKHDEGGLDLDIGSITLPTTYDIRRAIAGGTVQNHPNVQISNAPRITVNNYSSDDKVVGRALGRVLGTATDSAARSAGVA